MATKIPWCNAGTLLGETWNPAVGCTKCSPGCANCYAERMAWRLKTMGRPQYQEVVDDNGWTGKVQLVESALDIPRRWKKPRFIFVPSMGDLFHEGVPGDYMNRVFEVMDQCPQHTFAVLTKRADRMMRYATIGQTGTWDMVSKNVWLGVSVCNRGELHRVDILRNSPGGKSFVSFEPLLESPGYFFTPKGLDWVIVGCEKLAGGRPGRPCDPYWVRDIRDKCQDADIPFWLKQMPSDGKRVSENPLLDGVRWTQRPETDDVEP